MVLRFSDDLQTWNRMLLGLYSPELEMGNYLSHAYRFLEQVVSLDQINYGNLDPQNGTMDVATNRLTPEWEDAVRGFGACMKEYPYFSFDPTVNEAKPFFVSVRQFRNLDIYSECFRLLAVDQHAAVYVPTSDRRLMWFGLERSGLAYGEEERVLLTAAQQHLTRAHRLASNRSDMRGEQGFGPEVFLHAGFTGKEAEVCHWLTEGKTNVEIAILMGLRPATVKGHVTNLFNKCGTGNRLALTLHLMEMGRRLSRCPVAMRKVGVPRGGG